MTKINLSPTLNQDSHEWNRQGGFKGAVPRNSAKLGNTKCPSIQEKHKNNRLKH